MNPWDFDQFESGLNDLARLSRAYYESLEREGFTNEQALWLTERWVASALGIPSNQMGERP